MPTPPMRHGARPSARSAATQSSTASRGRAGALKIDSSRRCARNLVVVSPARNASSRAIHSRSGRFVRTPSTAKSRAASLEPRDRRRAIAPDDDEFREHRIVVVAHLAAGRRRRNRGERPGPCGGDHCVIVPVEGSISVGRVLGVDARLDRPAPRPHVVLRESSAARRRRCAAASARDRCRRPVRLPDARPASARSSRESRTSPSPSSMNSHGAGIDVADRLARPRTAAAPMRARSSGVKRDRRRFLDDFLMTALNRALALAEVHRRAVRVGEDLKLDVTRIAQISFEQHRVVAEGRARFALRRCERFVELCRDRPRRACRGRRRRRWP